MGSLMARIFSGAGFPVEILDKKAGDVRWDAVSRHDVTIIAAPLPVMDTVVREIGPFTRKDGVVIDIGSLKQEPIQQMLSHCQGEVIGSHPLFGPATTDLNGQIVFTCPARSTNWMDWFQSFWERKGARVVEIDAARHDKLMATVQALRHLYLFSFGHSLIRLGFDLSTDLPLAGPWFSDLVSMLRHHVQQGPAIYNDLAKANPHTKAMLNQVAESVEVMRDAYQSDDPTPFHNLIGEITRYFDQPQTAGMLSVETEASSVQKAG